MFFYNRTLTRTKIMISVQALYKTQSPRKTALWQQTTLICTNRPQTWMSARLLRLRLLSKTQLQWQKERALVQNHWIKQLALPTVNAMNLHRKWVNFRYSKKKNWFYQNTYCMNKKKYYVLTITICKKKSCMLI